MCSTRRFAVMLNRGHGRVDATRHVQWCNNRRPLNKPLFPWSSPISLHCSYCLVFIHSFPLTGRRPFCLWALPLPLSVFLFNIIATTPCYLVLSPFKFHSASICRTDCHYVLFVTSSGCFCDCIQPTCNQAYLIPQVGAQRLTR